MLFFSVLGLLNYSIDPLWLFGHAHRWNARQAKIDERQQKANQLSCGFHDFDAVLLGSSRSTFISRYDFQGYRLFNFAVDAMLPEEYPEYIEYAKRQSRPGLKLIVLGLDFYGTNLNFRGYGQRRPQDYFRDAGSPAYRFGSLFAFDTLKYSLKNIANSYARPAGFCYSRDNVKSLVPAPRKYRELALQEDLRVYRERMYGNGYRYKDMRRILGAIREANPGIRIVAFTTPTSQPLWELLLAEGRLDDYCRWIGDIVASFGEVYNFMGINRVTSNLANYNDGHHFYPSVGALIAHRLLAVPDPGLPEDFGQRITGENLDQFVAEMRRSYSRVPGSAKTDRGN